MNTEVFGALITAGGRELVLYNLLKMEYSLFEVHVLVVLLNVF